MINSLELQNLQVHFPGFCLGPIDLTLPKGRVLAYIGPNGSGKTTTIKTIMGAIKPNKGSVIFEGELISNTKGDRKWVNSIGLVTDSMLQWNDITAKQYLNFLSKMYDNWSNDYMLNLMKRLDLKTDTKIADLSTGDATKLNIIAAMSHQPRLLLLDEPTNGLDPYSRNEMIDILFEFMQSEENAIIYSSHILPEIDKIADDILLLIDGKPFLHSDKSELLENWRKIFVPKHFVLEPDSLYFDISTDENEKVIITNDFQNAIKDLAAKSIEVVRTNYISLEAISLIIMKKRKYENNSN